MTTFEISIDDSVYKKLLEHIKLFRLVTGISITRDLLTECCITYALNDLGEGYFDYLEKGLNNE